MWILVACSPATYEGRPIAPVMSWQFADSLERPGRAEQEGTDAMIAALPLDADDVVVDLGCGTGFHARRIAPRVARVVCVDLQPQMLAEARRRADALGLTNIAFVDGSAAKVEPGSADLVLLADVYHELSEPAQVLAELKRALSPSGQVAVVEFRLEGDSATFVRPEHRMTAEQVRREWTAAGWAVAGQVDSLPTQHLVLFRPE